MAATVTPLLTTLTTCETTTGWSSGNIDGQVQRQGSGCLAYQVSNATNVTTFTAGASHNLSTGRRHIYFWILVTTPGFLATTIGSATGNQAGIRFRIGQDTSNYREWNLAGATTYPGGWVCYVVDPLVAPDVTVGSPNNAIAQAFSVVVQTTSMIAGNAPNTFVDAMRYGTGLRITGTDGTLDEVATIDGSSANAYGIMQRQTGILAIQGELEFGAGTSFSFQDGGEVGVFQSRLAADNLYEIRASENAVMNFGFFTGGVPQNGMTKLAVPGRGYYLNAGSGIMNLYASNFTRANKIDLNGMSEAVGSQFTQCGLITPNGATMTDCIFANGSDTVAVQVNSPTEMAVITGANFLGNDRAIEITQAGTYTFNNIQFAGNNFGIRNSSGGAVTVNLTNGSNSPAPIDNVGGSTTEVLNAVTHQITGLVDGSEVRYYRVSDDVELAGVENSSGGTFEYAYNYEEDIPVYIHIHHIQYVFIRLELTLGGSNASVPVQQRFDRIYSNPE